MNKRSLLLALAAILILLSFFTNVADAQVQVVRGGEENPVVTIAKSTLYGAGAGLLLGFAAALVVENNEGEIIKWSFVGGTFGGFLFGVYHAATRPKPTASLLKIQPDGLAKWSLPQPQVRLSRDGSFAITADLVEISF
jgi:hypothetical protein